MADVDYGYGDAEPDYGYGAEEDMGYGDAAPDVDYGYGDSPPADDYGYGAGGPDDAPAPQPTKEEKRPKRRCSVTKFSLQSETPLTAASVINDFRNGVEPTPVEQVQPDCATADADCGKSAVTADTLEIDAAAEGQNPGGEGGPKKKGVMKRIRKRLSIAF